jgi:hypothetical protein
MTRYIVGLLALAAPLSACRPPLEKADEFRRGVPTAETVKVSVPGDSNAGQALTVETHQQALRGFVADYAKLTWAVTTVINGGGLFIGTLVRVIIAFPPTSITGDTAVWGPWAGDREAITWKMTVDKVGEHQFQYRLQGQLKGNTSAPWETILAGTHTAALDDQGDPMEGFGNGSFTLDWDARAKLPDAKPNEVGKAHYTYSRVPGDTATVDAQFMQVRDNDTGKLVDVDYGFTRAPGGGGTMEFTHNATAQLGMPAGRYSVRSRWERGGAGRSDARAMEAGGQLVTVSECWNTSFLSMYLKLSAVGFIGYGDEAMDCTFPTAEWSKL